MMNATQKEILMMLAANTVVSGQSIAQRLSISRSAVWKAIRALQAKGFAIKAIGHQGYCLKERLEFFDEVELKRVLVDRIDAPFSLRILDEVDSTNDYALKTVPTTMWEIILAETQTKGRGRRGRAWQSPYGKHIYLTICFWQPHSMSSLHGLSLVAGLSILQSLREQGLANIKLKWPNDLWLESKKIAGILIDIKGEANHGFNVALGLGMNVQEDLNLHKLGACALGEFSEQSKTALVASIVPALIQSIDMLRNKGFAYFIDAYNKEHYFHQKNISIEGHPDIKSGVVMGVSDTGGLWVEHQGIRHCLYAADISIRDDNFEVET